MNKAIIFDLDGTLWDTTKEVAFVWSKIAKKYNLEIKNSQIRDIMGLTKSEIIKYFFYDDYEKGNKFITECQYEENKYLSEFGGNIYKNTTETLKKLYENYELFIVSNCQSGYIEAFLKHYNLEKYIKDYECSGNTGKDKKDNIKIVMQRNNIVDAVYIGDTQKDCDSSISNNIPFIWAKYGFGKNSCYDCYIEDIAELIDKIK